MELDTTNQQENPDQNFPKNPSILTSIISHNGLIFLLFGFVILLIVVAGGAYYLGTKQVEKKPTPLTQKVDVSPTLTTPPVTSVPETKNFKTRYFDTTAAFFDKEKYPLELISLQENQLKSISCTHTYLGDGKDNSFYDSSIQKNILLTDTSLLSYITTLSKKYDGKTLTGIFSCTPKEGKTIVVYGLLPAGTGVRSSISYVGLANNAGEIEEVSEIEESVPHFGCGQPLQLTSNNNFYFSCGGGDGAFGSASIYNLSLNYSTVSRLKYCENVIDEDAIEGKKDYVMGDDGRWYPEGEEGKPQYRCG